MSVIASKILLYLRRIEITLVNKKITRLRANSILRGPKEVHRICRLRAHGFNITNNTTKNLVEDSEWIYAWEESLSDEDGQLWVVTMMSHLVLPIYEEMEMCPLLFEPLETCLKHPEEP